VDALESLAASIPPMAYDIDSYASLGLLHACITLDDPDAPTPADVAQMQQSLHAALDDILNDPRRDLSSRLGAANRRASLTVREVLRKQWHAPSP
jgi:malonate decarboxylase gamma subunit